MTQTANILVVGSLNMDLVVQVAHLPAPGETILGRDFHTIPGGKGANQAVAAARLGAQVAIVGRVGQDAFGKQLMENLRQEGVETTLVSVDESAPSGIATITLDEQGQNSIVVASGANLHLSAEEVRRAGQNLTDCRVMVSQLEIPLECVIEAAKQAMLRKVPFILNPAPAQVLPAELLAMVDVLVPNESEAALLTGLPVFSLKDAEAAGRTLHKLGASAVIITMGANGALLSRAGWEALHLPAYQVNVVDTTAAGDAFVAGLAVGLVEGLPLEEAACWGNAAGAIAVTRLGAQPAMPTREEIQALLGTPR
jgi:ribokinase